MKPLAALALCPILGLAGCGLIPRSDYAEGKTISRVYALDYRRLSTCTYDLIEARYGRTNKADFPERQTTRLSRDADGIVRVWQVDLAAEGRDRTRVTMPVPMTVGTLQPEAIFELIGTCAPVIG